MRHLEDLHVNSIKGNQPGNPEKAADTIIAIAVAPNPPVHLLLGQDALDMTVQKMDSVKAEVETWKELSLSTAF